MDERDQSLSQSLFQNKRPPKSFLIRRRAKAAGALVLISATYDLPVVKPTSTEN